MYKFISALFIPLILSGCFDKESNHTVYDYLQNKELLEKDFSKCVSGEIKDVQKCNTVKSAKGKYSFFVQGMYSEDELRQLGKK